MCSRSLSLVTLAVLLTGTGVCARELRVCADPDNLPFSNAKQEGFENKIARIVGAELHAEIVYVWQRMGRGFVREYLDTGKCDALIGIPVNFRAVLTTSPYYRSTYVFVVRRDARLKPVSLDDANLRDLKIGVQALDEQYAPPGEALAHRGLQSSLIPFYGVGSNADSIISAVAQQKVDAAVVWGPLAGYLAKNYHGSLQIIAVKPEMDPPAVPFTFEIAMGVRKANEALRKELEAVVQSRRNEIRSILDGYGVPQLELTVARKDAD